MQRFAVALLAAALSAAAADADTRAVALVVTDAQGFGFEGPNALLDTLVEAVESLGRESGRRRALVSVSGAGAGHTTLSPGDVSSQVRKGGAQVLGVMCESLPTVPRQIDVRFARTGLRGRVAVDSP